MDVWVYMLKCADGSYYVGSARFSLDRRLAQHQSGELGGYTSTRRPVTLVWSADFQFVTDAIACERRLKGWSRAKKEALIRGDYPEISRLAHRRSSSFETAAARPPQDEERVKDRLHDMTTISLILARADNGVIGKDGGLPWRLPEDMRHFKSLTMGKPAIMGRKTWVSLPEKFRPLPGRANIVMSRDPGFKAPGASVVTSFDAAMAAAGAGEAMVIGGAAIYAAALPHAGRVYLTEIHTDADGEVCFPAFPPEQWLEISRENHVSGDGLRFSFVQLQRKIT